MTNPLLLRQTAMPPGSLDDLAMQYDQMMNPMLQSTGDPAFDAKRQEMYAQSAAMQGNAKDFMPYPQEAGGPLKINVGMIPQNEMIASAPETMTMPQANAMLTKPNNIIEAGLMGMVADEGQAPFSDYVSSNWQGLLSEGIAGLQDNAYKENLPADVYLKMRSIENEKTLAEQNQFLNNLKLQADLDYQRQSIDLKKEELAMERQKVLTGGDLPASIKQTQWYMNADPEARAIYDRTNKIGLDSVDIGGKQVFVDKVTGQVIGEIDKTLAPENLPQTRQEQAVATEVGKELGAAEAKLNAMEAALPGLNQVTDKLSKLGKIATYTSAGQVRDTALRELGMEIPDAGVARTEYMTTIDNEVLPLLRDTFGAAFTVEEGNRLRSTLGNENMSPKEKDAALRSFIDSKTREIGKLQRQTGKETVAPVAPQIDPSLLEFMTPEERALFQ